MKFELEGFRAAGIACGIKSDDTPDLALIVSDRPAAAAGVFTTSQFPGAPVVVSRRHLRKRSARAVVVNSRIANVANGEQGVRDAREMAALVAQGVGARIWEVQVASTGVIGWRLPMDKLRRGIPRALETLSPKPAAWKRAARAIMTTDTKPKLVAAAGRGFGLVGMAKGAGMIMPNMATMLCYLATDLAVEPRFLDDALREAVGPSLNSLTIDGETSTSDTAVVLANGAAGNRPLERGSARAGEFRRVLDEVCAELAEKLALDGEGVTRLAEIRVQGARSARDAQRVARSVGNSALFKTALFGADPNWGRVVQAIGAAGVRLRPECVGIRFGGVEMLRHGEPCGGPDALRRAQRALKRKRVPVEISLGDGPGEARLLTTDFSYEYVRINGEYTT